MRLELLEHIYADMYTQRITTPDETQWQHQILTNSEVSRIVDLPGSKDRVTLVMRNHSEEMAKERKLEVDAVIVATGYVRDAHADILKQVDHLRPELSTEWSVGRDYRIKLDRSKVSDDAGVWLQGCNESTHGVRTIYWIRRRQNWFD